MWKYSEDEALCLLIDAQLSKRQYTTIQLQAKAKGANISPAYTNVRAAKERCFPDPVTATESGCEVSLQALVDLTTRHLLLIQEGVVGTVVTYNGKTKNVVLISKWCCSESTGHSQYKQKASSENLSDSDLFLSSVVPLQLYLEKDSNIILWQNPRTSLPRFCRPIRFQFKKETFEVANTEVQYIESQILMLLPTEVTVLGCRVNVRHEFLLTMIDGKICNALTSTSSAQRCYIYRATLKEMNDLVTTKEKQVNFKSFSFGLSTLHVWIQFFQCLLHISYRTDIKKW